MKKHNWKDDDHVSTKSGLADDVGLLLQFWTVETFTSRSGIWICTSRDSSPSGQITIVAPKLANVQICPLASGADRISGRSADLAVTAPSNLENEITSHPKSLKERKEIVQL